MGRCCETNGKLSHRRGDEAAAANALPLPQAAAERRPRAALGSGGRRRDPALCRCRPSACGDSRQRRRSRTPRCCLLKSSCFGAARWQWGRRGWLGVTLRGADQRESGRRGLSRPVWQTRVLFNSSDDKYSKRRALNYIEGEIQHASVPFWTAVWFVAQSFFFKMEFSCFSSDSEGGREEKIY